MKRLAAIALLLALAAPLRADRIAVAVVVTNAPTHGLTLTLNGSTRTWTTNAPSATQMRISATNSVSASNFYASVAANPFSGRVTLAQTSSNVVTLYGADGQAMVVTFPSDSWGFYTATTNATTPGSITRADYATTANTASNATAALALALTNGFVKASITNGLVGEGFVTSSVGTATNAADVMRIPLYSSANIAASSNAYVLNPFAIAARAAGSQILIPSKYRYIRKYVVVIPKLGNYGETNWVNPTVMFQIPSQISDTAYQQVETEHGGANTVAGFWYSWSNFPNVWVRSLYASASSGKGIVWATTNSVEIPAAWWSNANAFASGSYSFGQGTLINLNSFSMSNGAPVSGYIEFATTPTP